LAGSDPFSLGAFDLEELLGRGSNGEVWRATHRHTKTPVAVKVLTSREARLPEVTTALETEVRSVAALDHPNIIMLLDLGRIEGRNDHFPPESPYLVMELASGGPLEGIRPLRRYEHLRAILLALLDALAHAHARGVLHRDLAPRNILIAKKDDLRPGLKIADFGIAMPLARSVETEHEDGVIGTLAFMAPEQLRARWRDYGPWTDLFSVGLIAQRLATGRQPFEAQSPSQMFEARLFNRRAPLDPLFPLPNGFGAWLDRMVEVDPAHRFQRASDAAYALAELTSPEDFDEFDDTTVRAIGSSSGKTLAPLAEAPTDPRPSPERPPPMPKTWRHSRPVPPPVHLVGAGLGLYKFRSVPFVDRDAERDAIWSAMTDVRRDGRPRMCVISGPGGAGRSRLAEWMAQRAHELGTGTILGATFAEIAGRSDGLGPMLERFFRTSGLHKTEALEQVKSRLAWYGVLDDVMARAIARVTHPPIAIDEESFTGLDERSDRYEVLRGFLARIGSKRPVVMLLDDVHYGADALSFVEQVFGTPRATPVLFLATCSPSILERRLIESALLHGLLESSRTTKIDLAPLGPEHHRELLEKLVPLAPDALDYVGERTKNNPLLAVELIGEWIDRGVLESSDSGFRVRAGPKPRIPTRVDEVWMDQLERLTRDRPGDWWPALEIAAVLGQHVDRREWAKALDSGATVVGDEARKELERALLDGKLATTGPRGFAFAHPRLVASLVHRAAAGGRLESHHDACARAIEAVPSNAERLATHLLGAGRAREADPPLLAAARALYEQSDFVGARALLDRRDAILDRELVVDGASRGLGWVLRAEVLFSLGLTSESEAYAARALREGESLEWQGVVPAATFVMARIAHVGGDLDRARELLVRAADLFRREASAAGEAACMRELGAIDLALGDLARAEGELEGARDRFEGLGDSLGIARAEAHLGLLSRRKRNIPRSMAHYQRAFELFREAENRYGMALSLNGLGDALRHSGEIAEAEACYREAEHAYESIAASVDAATPRINLALLALEREDYEGAARIGDAVRNVLERGAKRAMLACAHAVVLPQLAVGEASDEWDRRLAAAKQLLSESRFVDPDVAFTLELSGRLAAQNRWVDRARACYQLAVDQYRRLGRAADADRVVERLVGLDVTDVL
jgi:serine/threonine protein kinase/tetratricopeptide (TPR) repeat protein